MAEPIEMLFEGTGSHGFKESYIILALCDEYEIEQVLFLIVLQNQPRFIRNRVSWIRMSLSSALYNTQTGLVLFWNMSRTTRVSRYQKGKTRKVKTNLDLLEQEIMSGSGICWAICKSAPHPRQPCQHPTTQFFTGRMPFLPPNQQHQSTEGIVQSSTVNILGVIVCLVGGRKGIRPVKN